MARGWSLPDAGFSRSDIDDFHSHITVTVMVRKAITPFHPRARTSVLRQIGQANGVPGSYAKRSYAKDQKPALQ